ncbi:MAG: acetate--CoA ligase [Desulfobacterales bacterium]
MNGFMFHASGNHRKEAWINSRDDYEELYRKSMEDPDGFWGDMAETFFWEEKWTSVRDYNFHLSKGPVYIQWFIGAKTNITYNCIDRHLESRRHQPALIWEGNTPGEDRVLTYGHLYDQVCRFANCLRSLGIKKGDRVAVYMPMIPELAVAMLAAARIGAVHSVVFGGFSAEALADRILDSGCRLLITADGFMRGDKAVDLKRNADTAMAICERRHHRVHNCIVVKRSRAKIPMASGRDIWWHDMVKDADPECPVVWMDAEDPLFILYTSGSTGKPKGVQHTVGGYMVYTGVSFKYIFDYHDGDRYWCTADIGWITGHSYIVYGPLSQGAVTLMFEGVPNYPDPGRFWAVVDKWRIHQFYTAPTAIRALMAQGEEWVLPYDLSSLRLLGTVGEPINPEAWMWYFKHVGKERCPIVDTWWQTETGGIMISPLPYAIGQKPGSAALPFFSVKPVLLTEKGDVIHGTGQGLLAIEQPWPGQLRTVFGDHTRLEQTYFLPFDGYYLTGDGCRRDEDGYFWITGRVDDVINVSGHRLGTAEVESALVAHPDVAEAAVTGFPHPIKGQGIYAYVTLRVNVMPDNVLIKNLKNHVREEIGPIATPDVIHFSPALPKTRSGKIMRRILKKIASDDYEDLGDTTTLADPLVVNQLIDTHKDLIYRE